MRSEKLFNNYAYKLINTVRRKLEQAILYIERTPETTTSISSPPSSDHFDMAVAVTKEFRSPSSEQNGWTYINPQIE